MNDAFVTGVVLFLGTYALHSTFLLGGVWLFERLRRNALPALRETLWRTALPAAILTTALQISGIAQPVLGYVSVRLAEPSSGAEATNVERTAVALLPRDEIHSSSDGFTPDESKPTVSSNASSSPSRVAETQGRSPLQDTRPIDNLLSVPLDGHRILLTFWLAGVLALSARLLLTALAAHRELADRTPIVRGPLFRRIQVIAHDAGVRRLPRVSMSARISGPLTLPNGEICIPVWAYDKLSPCQLDAMLAHELAHALRRDPLWLVAALAVQTVFFFQPLNVLARKRLALLAELSADDWAATRTGNSRALAECLAEFAEVVHTGAAPGFGAAIAHGQSSLVERVRRLLDGRSSSGVVAEKVKILIALAAVSLASVIPGLYAQDGNADPRRSSVTFHTNDREMSLDISMRTDEYRLRVKGEGEIAFAPDGSGVSMLSDGSYLDVELDRDGMERRMRFEGNDGEIEREFWIDGDAQPWGADAERFVAEVMPVLFRQTGITAAERVAWLLQERGHEALLEEIELIGGDFVQRLYTVHYAESGEIPDAHLRRLMRILEYEMGSDFELRTTLTSIYRAQTPTGDNLVALVNTAKTIGSDFEARTLLETVGDALPDTPDGMRAYLDLAATIGSDFEMRHALSHVLRRTDLAEDLVREVIEIAGWSIGSDFELRHLLKDAAPRVGASDSLARAYLDAAETIGSDFEHRHALEALAERAALSAAGWRALLASAQSIGGDFECASLLAAIAPRLPRSDEVVAAYAATLETIGSDFEHRRAADALGVTSL